MDFRLIRNIHAQAKNKIVKSLKTKVMTPEEFGRKFSIVPFSPRLYSYHNASYPVVHGTNWEKLKRQKHKKNHITLIRPPAVKSKKGHQHKRFIFPFFEKRLINQESPVSILGFTSWLQISNSAPDIYGPSCVTPPERRQGKPIKRRMFEGVSPSFASVA